MFPVAIRGDAIEFRELEPADAASLAVVIADEAVLRYTTWKGPTDLEAAEGFVRMAQEAAVATPRIEYLLAIALGATGEVIGTGGIRHEDEASQVGSLRCLLRHDRWGRGVATEAAKLAIGRTPDPAVGQRRYLKSLSPTRRKAYATTLFGPRNGPMAETRALGGLVRTSERGCLAQARRELYGSATNYLLVSILPQGIYGFQHKAWRDRSVIQAMRHYRDCMRSAGYYVAHPQAARELAESEFGNRLATEEASRDERRMAVADASCQARSAVLRLYAEALMRYASGWLAEEAAQLRRAAEIRLGAIARVRSILGRIEEGT